ncbi:Hypothetical protein PHPALM_842 [Phytophthora palmivora]|uniref:Uncharacterized protein n=1 Tax=Phytophthora palmivora TaxID=4796 RepID=A0A2P4YTU3_9STRA|nr:Hypothetical protein PHPALM_842 [Phytophthora palmivora]
MSPQLASPAIKAGKRLKDQAAMMTLEDLKTMCKVLFTQNEVRALMDRTLLTSQWLPIGRSSDIGNILFDDLHWLGDFLVIDLTRLKVRQQHSISLFCFPGNWAIDPYHSLACQLIADPWNASDRVFS